MQIGKLEIDVPVFLAPMAGVTDWAYRCICAQIGAGVTVTEMVSSRALVYQDRKSASLLRKNPGSICGAQIFGSEPEIMAQGARRAMELCQADYLDINMGCPMGKVVSNGDGAALMRDPDRAARIVEAVKQAVEVPVTVKCRLGWDRGSIQVVSFARRMQQAGCDAIAIHGRTRAMLYSGAADWDTIKKVKDAVTIPVIANGDIFSGEAAVQCRKRTGADGLMIGRAAFGDPWIFQEVLAALSGSTVTRPPLAQRMETALAQFRLAMEDKGEHIACLEARKHLAWYLRGVPHSGWYKAQISQLSSCQEVEAIVRAVQSELHDAP